MSTSAFARVLLYFHGKVFLSDPFCSHRHVLKGDTDKARAVHSPHLSDMLPCAYLTAEHLKCFYCSFVSLKAFLQCLLISRCCNSKKHLCASSE